MTDTTAGKFVEARMAQCRHDELSLILNEIQKGIVADHFENI